MKRCVFCGVAFEKDPPNKPDLLKFVETCWTCSARIARAQRESEERKQPCHQANRS